MAKEVNSPALVKKGNALVKKGNAMVKKGLSW